MDKNIYFKLMTVGEKEHSISTDRLPKYKKND